ncbi:MAG TPA: phage tail sheath C-terminal domain-containing protein [Pseudolabrys sp.]|nr:phage tail sheath C-terminal domain-containing protein [Pseudolabrys sp.]
MPVTPSFPGLYIEELPLSAHSIVAAPTSITVIVGYTHPYKTNKYREAVRLFSFTEYEREFGGNFASGMIEPHVPQAVAQFFANGGSDLYVVGLEATLSDGATPTPTIKTYKDVVALSTPLTFTGTDSKTMIFRPLEPTDLTQMQLTLSNLRQSTKGLGNPYDTFDVAISYGKRVETFRNVTIKSGASGTQLYALNGASALITVEDSAGKKDNTADFGLGFGAPPPPTFSGPLAQPVGYGTNFNPQDFIDMFQADTSLDKVPIFNILLTPGIYESSVNPAALAFAERKRAFVILDGPGDRAADKSLESATPPVPSIENDIDTFPLSENGALYFPYLQVNDPFFGQTVDVAPSGFVAGIYARTDTRRGVWKAPAGIEATLNGTIGVVARGNMTNEQQGVLYGTITQKTPINCLRSFPGSGTVVFGARTLVGSNQAYNQSKYVPVRRMTLFIEQTLLANLRWVVFEPNDEPLWISIRTSIENFMLSLFNQGALQGSKPSDAFQVKCDHTTTTQQDIDNGVVNIIVAFAPLKPAEFVVIKIAQLAGQSQTS